MDIGESIKNTEYQIHLNKQIISMLEKTGLTDLADESKEQIKVLEKTLEHERKVQLAEAQTSGRKEWYHHPGIYALVYIGGIVTIKILEFALEKLS